MDNRGTLTHRRQLWIWASSVAALLVALGLGWWQDHKSQVIEADKLRAEIAELASLNSTGGLREQNEDLIRFIDEVYFLLQQEGMHIRLNMVVDKNGRYRLVATSAELLDELKAKFKELNAQPAPAPP